MGRPGQTLRSLPAACRFVLIIGSLAGGVLLAKERESHQPVGWCYIQHGPIELAPKALGRKNSSLTLNEGELVPVLKTEAKNGRRRALVRITNLSTLSTVDGWIDTNQAEILPIDRFPASEALLRELRLKDKIDFPSAQTAVARWLVKQANSGTALVCFVAASGAPAARLVAFLPEAGNYKRGPWIEFPFSEMKPGIVSGEVRDLVGDGNECLVTHEPYRQGPAAYGVDLAIRRLERGSFATLWTAPLESRNLESFPSDVEVLRPLEKNVGRPGTVTKAEVEFQAQGKLLVPVWKARIEFRAVGQDDPVNSVEVTKVCAWTGSSFKPVY